MLIALVVLLVPAPAAAAPDGPTANQCRQVDEHLVTPCYGADVLARDGQAHCKAAGACASDEEAIAAYERSWTHRALAFQESLSRDVPLRDAPWIGTHNSFNSIAEMGPTLSDTDSNQQLRLTDQLRQDMRSLELDLHWLPSPYANGSDAPVVCHGEGNAGCTIEKPLAPVLDEIAGFLRAHQDAVLLLYLEDQLDGTDAHDAAAAAVREKLGSLVYAPPAGGACAKLPMDLTKADVLKRHAQVVIVSGCGEGAAWHGVAFDWSSHVEERPHGFQDFPRCGPDYDRAAYDTKLVRYYEDSTWLTTAGANVGQSSLDDGITPATAAAMTRCGVDLIGLDQLQPGDERLGALVWSWAPGEPSAGGCVVQRADGRWASSACQARRPAACRRADGTWTTTEAVPAAAAAGACRDEHATFAPPRTGYENARLRTDAAGDIVWLGLTRPRRT